MGGILSYHFWEPFQRCGFFHEEDIKLFGEIAIERIRTERLRLRVKKEHRKLRRLHGERENRQQEFPIPDTATMTFTSDEDGGQESETMVTIKGAASSDPRPSTVKLETQQDDNAKSDQIQLELATITTPVRRASGNLAPVQPKISFVSQVVKKNSPLERMKDREERMDHRAVTASLTKSRSEQRRLGSGSGRSSRGHSPRPGKTQGGNDSNGCNLGGSTASCVYDESSLRREIDAIRLETILDNEEDEEIQDTNNNETLYFFANGITSDYPGAPIYRNNENGINDFMLEDEKQDDLEIEPPSSYDETRRDTPSPVELRSPVLALSAESVTRSCNALECTIESVSCDNQDQEEPGDVPQDIEGSNRSLTGSPNLDSELPEIWSEVEIFALIEVPQREEPLRIEYHRFGSTLDFSTRPSMDPTFSTNMTHEEMSALFEGDLDVGSKYGAPHVLALIPKLMNLYAGFLLVNGLEVRINRTTKMAMKDLHVQHHNILLEVVPKSITEIELRRSASKFEIEWKDEVAIHTTKWMAVIGQQEKISQLQLSKSKESKSVLILTIPL